MFTTHILYVIDQSRGINKQCEPLNTMKEKRAI